MFSKFGLGASFASTAVQLLFFWGVELVLVLLLWKNQLAPQNNFLMSALLVSFWTLVCLVASFKLYAKMARLRKAC